jgi:hypothetical protein
MVPPSSGYKNKQSLERRGRGYSEREGRHWGPELRSLIPEDVGSTSFETSVNFYQTTRLHIPENSYPQFKTKVFLTYVRSEVLTAVVMKSSVFWDITPCLCILELL